jgi:hypothetical protein
MTAVLKEPVVHRDNPLYGAMAGAANDYTVALINYTTSDLLPDHHAPDVVRLRAAISWLNVADRAVEAEAISEGQRQLAVNAVEKSMDAAAKELAGRLRNSNDHAGGAVAAKAEIRAVSAEILALLPCDIRPDWEQSVRLYRRRMGHNPNTNQMA